MKGGDRMNEKFIVGGLLIAYVAVIGVVCWDSKKNPSRVVAPRSKDYYQGMQKGMAYARSYENLRKIMEDSYRNSSSRHH